jgi:hypothetical protein
MRKARPAEDEIRISVDGAVGVLSDGTSFTVPVGAVFRADDPIVQEQPHLFVKPGEPLVPPERPVPAEDMPPAPPPPRPAVRTLRSKRTTKIPIPAKAVWERPFTISLHEGRVFRESEVPWSKALNERQIAEYFDEVEEE